MWPVSTLIKGHQPLVAKLAQFDPAAAGKLVAALALAPELHANTLRIEALSHLAVFTCRGKNVPNGKNLIEWVGQFSAGSSFVHQEDPIEDVFVGCVSCASGSFRVLNGIANDKDFWVERLLWQLEEKRDFPFIQPALDEVVGLLRLTDALVDRIGLERYAEGAGQAAAQRIQVPSRSEMHEYLGALTFTHNDLAAIGVNPAALTPFLFSHADRLALERQTIWNSDLCRKPLQRSGDRIEFLMPSAVVRALECRILKGLLMTGLKGWADMFFQMACANEFVNVVVRRMGIQPLAFERPPIPKDMPPLHPFFGQFDIGKPAIVLTYCPPLTGALDDPDGHDEMNEQGVEAITNFLRACAEQLEKIPGFVGGLLLINVCDLRTFALRLPRVGERWQVQSAGLSDWLILSAQPEFTALRLWRFGQQRTQLEAGGTHLIDMAGLLNTCRCVEVGTLTFRLVAPSSMLSLAFSPAAFGLGSAPGGSVSRHVVSIDSDDPASLLLCNRK